jgi:formylglycine-generating enzyme required for sulfatase activity
MRQRFFNSPALFILALCFFVRTPSRLASQTVEAAAGVQEHALRPSPSEGMSLIPSATMTMGIDSSEVSRFQKLFDMEGMGLFEPEIPKHRVTIASFFMDQRLVTNAQFKAFVDKNPRWSAENIPANLHNKNYLRHLLSASQHDVPAGRENHPVVNVSWYAAVAYCQSVGKRLPTEAEFAQAARGNLLGPFPWAGEAIDKHRANYGASELGTTSPVASYPANGYGLYDMAGNVWEFLADEYRPYTSSEQHNPIAGNDLFETGNTFLQIKTRRVIRGGSYDGAAINLWVEYRDSHPPTAAKDFVGFRCAKSPGKD